MGSDITKLAWRFRIGRVLYCAGSTGSAVGTLPKRRGVRGLMGVDLGPVEGPAVDWCAPIVSICRELRLKVNSSRLIYGVDGDCR